MSYNGNECTRVEALCSISAERCQNCRQVALLPGHGAVGIALQVDSGKVEQRWHPMLLLNVSDHGRPIRATVVRVEHD